MCAIPLDHMREFDILRQVHLKYNISESNKAKFDIHRFDNLYDCLTLFCNFSLILSYSKKYNTNAQTVPGFTSDCELAGGVYFSSTLDGNVSSVSLWAVGTFLYNNQRKL